MRIRCIPAAGRAARWWSSSSRHAGPPTAGTAVPSGGDGCGSSTGKPHAGRHGSRSRATRPPGHRLSAERRRTVRASNRTFQPPWRRRLRPRTVHARTFVSACRTPSRTGAARSRCPRRPSEFRSRRGDTTNRPRHNPPSPSPPSGPGLRCCVGGPSRRRGRGRRAHARRASRSTSWGWRWRSTPCCCPGRCSTWPFLTGLPGRR
jgi:hypothetical protein